ncbi:MAG TPA: amidohydrolase family protein [Burkholderiaceae bacterium]
MSAIVDLREPCDCHLHVYDTGYALAPTATFKPPHAPASAYREVQRRLSLRRAIVVQPTGYGFDNRCTLAAIDTLGPQARGIAVIPPGLPQAELQALHAAGIRGVRFMMLAGGVLPWSSLEPIAERIASLGWHINLQLDGRDLPQFEARLLALRCRVAIDHVGKFLGPVAESADSVASLHRLLDSGHCWIKLSAPYESSINGPPDYADIAPLAATLARRHPQRCLWASNWPHPNVRPSPDEAALFAWARDAVDDARTWQQILVHNPAQLYGFEVANGP